MKHEKIVSLDASENFTIRVFGRNLCIFHHHLVMEVETTKSSFVEITIKVEKITHSNIDKCKAGDFNFNRMQSYLDGKSECCEGFLFYEEDKPVGYLWVMYRGGNEYQYRVRTIDALLFNVCVFEEERGRSYCGQMLNCVFQYLSREKQISTVHLAVRRNNKSALRSYEKLGAKTIAEKKFVRILRVNIPYHKL